MLANRNQNPAVRMDRNGGVFDCLIRFQTDQVAEVRSRCNCGPLQVGASALKAVDIQAGLNPALASARMWVRRYTANEPNE